METPLVSNKDFERNTYVSLHGDFEDIRGKAKKVIERTADCNERGNVTGKWHEYAYVIDEDTKNILWQHYEI